VGKVEFVTAHLLHALQTLIYFVNFNSAIVSFSVTRERQKQTFLISNSSAPNALTYVL
jgi:hypothetical protein